MIPARFFRRIAARAALGGVLTLAFAVPLLAAPARRITIPDQTPISVSTVKTLLPRMSSPLETFKIRANNDVVVDGYVVVKKGALGQGTITETASHKFTQIVGGLFHGGGVTALKIRFDWITAVDGEKLRVWYATTAGTPEGSNPPMPSPQPEYATTTSVSRSSAASGAIPPVQTFTTYVRGTVHVVSRIAQRGAVENQSGFAH